MRKVNIQYMLIKVEAGTKKSHYTEHLENEMHRGVEKKTSVLIRKKRVKKSHH